MNKIFSCADDLNIKTYYQGTDSIHLNYDDVPLVVKRYKGKYGLELVGEDLGDFHIDLPQKDGYKDVDAIESFCLGRKSYIDILGYVNDEGDKIHDQHVRMKGFPTSCIECYAKINKISVLYVYNKLYKNGSIEHDLTNGNNTCVFRNNKDHTMSSLHKYDKGATRTCKFVRNGNGKRFIN